MSSYKLVLNCRALSNEIDGIGKYIINLGMGLQRSHKLNVYFFNGRTCSQTFSTPNNKNRLRSIIRDYLPFSYETREIVNKYFFKKENHKKRFNLYHEPSILPLPFKGPTILTVHDLSWVLYPHLHPVKRTKFLTDNFNKKLQQANSIITDSDFVKNQIIDIFNISSSKINTIYLGIDNDYRPKTFKEVYKTLAEFNLTYDNFFLYIGTIEPRKNLMDVIHAYLKLPLKLRLAFPLVLVGRYGWNDKNSNFEIENYLQNSTIFWIKYQAKEKVTDLVASARLLIYPSFYEGFGFPPLEALKSNTPVLCSNIPTLREILKNHVSFADNGNVDSFYIILKKFTQITKNENKLLKKSKLYSNKFTWQKCINKTLDLYNKVIDSHL